MRRCEEGAIRGFRRRGRPIWAFRGVRSAQRAVGGPFSRRGLGPLVDLTKFLPISDSVMGFFIFE